MDVKLGAPSIGDRIKQWWRSLTKPRDIPSPSSHDLNSRTQSTPAKTNSEKNVDKNTEKNIPDFNRNKNFAAPVFEGPLTASYTVNGCLRSEDELGGCRSDPNALKLLCSVQPDAQDVCFFWTKDGEEIFPRTRISIFCQPTSSQLTLSYPQTSDSGEYKCTAVNVAGRCETTTYVNVKCMTPTNIHNQSIKQKHKFPVDQLGYDCEVDGVAGTRLAFREVLINEGGSTGSVQGKNSNATSSWSIVNEAHSPVAEDEDLDLEDVTALPECDQPSPVSSYANLSLNANRQSPVSPSHSLGSAMRSRTLPLKNQTKSRPLDSIVFIDIRRQRPRSCLSIEENMDMLSLSNEVINSGNECSIQREEEGRRSVRELVENFERLNQNDSKQGPEKSPKKMSGNKSSAKLPNYQTISSLMSRPKSRFQLPWRKNDTASDAGFTIPRPKIRVSDARSSSEENRGISTLKTRSSSELKLNISSWDFFRNKKLVTSRASLMQSCQDLTSPVVLRKHDSAGASSENVPIQSPVRKSLITTDLRSPVQRSKCARRETSKADDDSVSSVRPNAEYTITCSVESFGITKENTHVVAGIPLPVNGVAIVEKVSPPSECTEEKNKNSKQDEHCEISNTPPLDLTLKLPHESIKHPNKKEAESPVTLTTSITPAVTGVKENSEKSISVSPSQPNETHIKRRPQLDVKLLQTPDKILSSATHQHGTDQNAKTLEIKSPNEGDQMLPSYLIPIKKLLNSSQDNQQQSLRDSVRNLPHFVITKSWESEIDDDTQHAKFPLNLITQVGVDPNTRYHIMEQLGKGKFGKVRSCVCRKTGKLYAAKEFRIGRLKRHKGDLMEIAVLKAVGHHPQIAHLVDVFEFGPRCIMITELVSGGALFDRIRQEGTLNECITVKIVKQILKGLYHLKKCHVIHCDLKPENLIMCKPSGYELKLIDFGLAIFHDSNKTQHVPAGTLTYLAPETQNYDPLSYSVDLWSLAVIAYEILSGITPFEVPHEGDPTRTLSNTEISMNITLVRYTMEEEGIADASPEAKDFIRKILVRNPSRRPTVEECFQHPWMTMPDYERPKVSRNLSLRRHNSQLRRKLAARTPMRASSLRKPEVD